ncbi:hypothetical protein [Piscinibacter gummiphilus]|uniref:Uncharacterized protein n=1 Tax=Piscinibacter gummiphilus TaxID=946333 RepID=A0A1W6L5W5_9BURK|nr:hypothetical protein [Piscinibacter gummiphilus]ARN19577.1 hypothetical protein A4W93_06420 [Piscinibacter gummiphilus]ATU64245.1 hypothetical protein CPZ87_06505 [Piscinibacter gummiphilus]
MKIQSPSRASPREREMPGISAGSSWRKWDLDVHTPESFRHNYTVRLFAAIIGALTTLHAYVLPWKTLGH